MPRSHFNGFPFNTGHFNGAYLGEAANSSMGRIVFDGFSLSDKAKLVRDRPPPLRPGPGGA